MEDEKIIEMVPKDAPETPTATAEDVAIVPVDPEAIDPPNPWEKLDIKQSPFKWPDEERNLYTNGVKCSLWGRSAADMKQADLILFVGYLNILYSQLVQTIKTNEVLLSMDDKLEPEGKEQEEAPKDDQ